VQVLDDSTDAIIKVSENCEIGLRFHPLLHTSLNALPFAGRTCSTRTGCRQGGWSMVLECPNKKLAISYSLLKRKPAAISNPPQACLAVCSLQFDQSARRRAVGGIREPDGNLFVDLDRQELVKSECERWAAEGINIKYETRKDRAGYK